MEDQRSQDSGFSPVEARRSHAFSPHKLTAGVAAIVLLLAISWSIAAKLTGAQQDLHFVASPVAYARAGNDTGRGIGALFNLPSPNASSSSPIQSASDIGPVVVGALVQSYNAMQQQGTYTPQAGSAVAQQLASAVQAPIPFKTYSAADITTTPDTSYARMLKYRADMAAALAPFNKDPQPEFELMGLYTETKDSKYLDKLRAMADNYAAAADNLTKVVVPTDALSYHLQALNATSQFGAVLNTYADNANDPIAAAVILESYTQAENMMLTAFNSLSLYYMHHAQP